MKITLFQGAFLPVPPLRGGAVEKMWFELGAEFAARGHQVAHVSRQCDGLAPTETLRGVQHRRVPGYEQPRGGLRLKLLDLFYTRRALKAAPDADIIVTNTFWAPVLARSRHGAIYVDVQRMPKGQLRLYRRAARLRANSSAVAEAIVREVPERAAHVSTIPNPLPFVPERPVNWAAKTKTVLFVGRLHPEKGLELLLEAWARQRGRGALAGWRLELVGPAQVGAGGGGQGWVRELQRRFGADDITWRGPVFDVAELNALYERATVFAYPSLAAKGETFGLAVLEAMAWGVVPVVSALACFRDFVIENRNGLFFDAAAPDAVGGLGAALQRAASPESRALAEEAIAVRGAYACSAIADRFLADFARLVR